MSKACTLLLLIFSLSDVQAQPLPAGDNAIIHLSLASLACSAIQKVNPEAVDKMSDNYLDNAIKLYQYYHNFPYEKAKENQMGMYNLLIGESVIKAQSLHSVVGAKTYLAKYLITTDANECSEIELYSQKLLAIYGKSL